MQDYKTPQSHWLTLSREQVHGFAHYTGQLWLLTDEYYVYYDAVDNIFYSYHKYTSNSVSLLIMGHDVAKVFPHVNNEWNFLNKCDLKIKICREDSFGG
jgi:predicted ferric reductase